MKDFFKKILGSGVIILVVIGVLYIIFLRECKTMKCPLKGQVLVDQKTWDDINSLANKPPIIKRDTIIIKGDVVYLKPLLPKPVPETKDSTINHYNDSLVNKEINVHYNSIIKGKLLDRSWTYVPLVKEIIVEKTIYVPKIIDNPVPVSRNVVYISGLAGGNFSTFLFGGELQLITKKNTVIGGVYQRWGNNNIYEFKIGIPIKFTK
jgi:hypothetical protein